jgi:hypothetical protein
LAPTTTIEAPSTTVAATTTETTSTTAGTAPELVVDEALAADFVAGVRDSWERTERTVGGSVPDLSDDEIVAIGTSVCKYLAANPLLARAQGQQPTADGDLQRGVGGHLRGHGHALRPGVA